MPLKNFGSILNFAAELEADDQAFYSAAALSGACSKYRAELEDFASAGKKNEKEMLRTCRESVCEMILEPIVDFTRTPFLSDRGGVENMSLEEVLSKALELETKAINFYTEGAEKIRALPEVSRALARTAKRRQANKERLLTLGQEESS